MAPPSHAVQAPVVVLGGGPVGIVSALALARRDIPVIMLERGPDEVRVWNGAARPFTRRRPYCSTGSTWPPRC